MKFMQRLSILIVAGSFFLSRSAPLTLDSINSLTKSLNDQIAARTHAQKIAQAYEMQFEGGRVDLAALIKDRDLLERLLAKLKSLNARSTIQKEVTASISRLLHIQEAVTSKGVAVPSYGAAPQEQQLTNDELQKKAIYDTQHLVLSGKLDNERKKEVIAYITDTLAESSLADIRVSENRDHFLQGLWNRDIRLPDILTAALILWAYEYIEKVQRPSSPALFLQEYKRLQDELGSLEKIVTEFAVSKQPKEEEKKALRSGVAFHQGKTERMEDGFVKIFPLPKNPDYGFFAIYDGHGGAETMKALSDEKTGFHIRIDELLADKTAERDMKVALQKAVLDVEKSLGADIKNSGASATMALINVPQKKAWVVNLGNARSFLIRNNDLAFITKDHLVSGALERKGIQERNGTITDNKIQGIMPISRAFGNKHIKGMGKIPDVTELFLQPGDSIVLLSSGITQELVDNEVKNKVSTETDLQKASQAIVDAALKGEIPANVTALVVRIE